MHKWLKRIYFALNGSVLLVIIIFNFMPPSQILTVNSKLSLILSISAVSTAFILPMWLRIYFFKRSQNSKMNKQQLFVFELYNIICSFITFALTIPAFLFDINLWIRYFVTFAAFYALYYYFPSDKKLNFDAKTFRIYVQ